MDGVVKGAGEALVSEVMGFAVAPKCFVFGLIWRVSGQPFDDAPVRPHSARCPGEFACAAWAIVPDRHDGPGGLSRLGTVKPVELFEMHDEVTAAPGLGGVHDEQAGRVIERSQHRDLLHLPRCGNAQVRSSLRPGTGEVALRQCLAFVAGEQCQC